jgi:hypothetical protein
MLLRSRLLVAGDTHTIKAINAAGQAVTGLTWTTSDSTIVPLSTDDPPVLTALAVGHVTIKAGSASADVIVSAIPPGGGSLPTGTVLWSNPASADRIVPAVPSPTGVADVFAITDSGMITAITSDGQTAWTASVGEPQSWVPDFQGGLVGSDFDGQHLSVQRLDGVTGQKTTLYAAGGVAGVHPDGTIFATDDNTGAVVGLNPTGGLKFSVPFPQGPSNIASGCGTSIGSIIAGDGNLYIPYGWQAPLPTGQWEHRLALFRVDTSGNSADITLEDALGFLGDVCSMPGGMITNSDQGVAVVYTVGDHSQMAFVNGTSVSLVSAPTIPGGGSQVAAVPVLQAQDGSFVGVADTGDGKYMVAFDQSGSMRWTVAGNWEPAIATSDGGLIARLLDQGGNEIGSAAFGNSGNATGLLGNMLTYSWKGAYKRGSVISTAAAGLQIASSYGAARRGNLTGNGAAIRTTRFGLAWCGTNIPGGLSSCGPDAPDVTFLYHNDCNLDPDADFTSAHPEWVFAIESEALATLKEAFAKYPVLVQWASKDGKTTWSDCQSDPNCMSTNVADQAHVVRVAGGTNPPSFGKTYSSYITPPAGVTVTTSNVYYYLVMTNSVSAWWNKESPGNATTWCPRYPPQSSEDRRKFREIMTTLGTAIGNAAAHELGHQLNKFPKMDCGPASVQSNPPYYPCESNDNFVYNFWNEAALPSDSNNPDDAANGGLFFYGLDVRPIHWSSRNSCYLKYWSEHDYKEDSSWWGRLFTALTSGTNPCQI